MTTGPAKILVVDDEDSLRLVIERTLRQGGFEVVTARNGKEALAKLTPAIDLVITDIHMPVMDGIEMLTQLRKDAPRAQIIAISGGAVQDKDQILDIAQRLGAALVLPKPFTSEDLLTAVGELLGGRAAAR